MLSFISYVLGTLVMNELLVRHAREHPTASGPLMFTILILIWPVSVPLGLLAVWHKHPSKH